MKRVFLFVLALMLGSFFSLSAQELEGGRYVTLCFMVRTTPWEVSRDVKLHPRDETDWHTLESVVALREAFAKNNPDGRLTWGFTLNALEDPRENYAQIRQYAVECHYRYGDEISYFPGYFPAMYLPEDRINREMSEAIAEISELVGNGYRPDCIMGGFLSAGTLKYLAEKENIHVAHAVIWSQHAIDGGGADGSPSYPFYPSTEHFCKPAQGPDDFIDCVNLDGWTMDFICARKSGASGHGINQYNSRRGVGPIETYQGWGLELGQKEVMHTESIHFDDGFEKNGFGWVTDIWETQMYHEFGKELMIPAMENWVGETKERWPDVKFITFGEFGKLWREAHPTNDWDYRFEERGSGLGDSYNNLEIRWFMNPEFRLALLKDWHKWNDPARVIDFTRYDLPAKEPTGATPRHPIKDWSLMNVINQKGTRPQDSPKLLSELDLESQEMIYAHYPELREESLKEPRDTKTPADYVNPTMGNISHILVPTFPTVHLPGGMLRITPERYDATEEFLTGLPVIVTSHRGSSAFTISPSSGPESSVIERMRYDNEHIHPYSYEADVADGNIHVKFAPAEQSAIYELAFREGEQPSVSLRSRNGSVHSVGDGFAGEQSLNDKVKVYMYMETDVKPVSATPLSDRARASSLRLVFPKGTKSVSIRYGVSFISEEQARLNLLREQEGFDLKGLTDKAKRTWNEALGKIKVHGGTEDERTVFYTSFYRILERPVRISEDGKYFSASDGKVHEDGGHPFYTDDWIWDTYRAAHPLRALLFPETEEDIIRSYILMAEQTGENWLPTFPEVTGDSRRMNSNHAVAMIADALYKGLSVDAEKGFEYGKKALQEKTLAPWSGAKAGEIDRFYKEHGYIPALRPGETETDPNVNGFEKRQPVAVTLGTAYDEWCLSRIAEWLGKKKEAESFRKRSLNYRNLFNPETGFFHPKDASGTFIEPFDYRFPGGPGARDSYDENNGWVYRWDVPHNVPDLVSLMGGPEKFVENLDRTFEEPLGMSKRDFYALMPDHTGNIGQFSMANEPSMHIPYLYNYAGAPWKTQKRVRQLLSTWFRNDLMGVPGDEDGGGLSSFVVFSMMGFYPVTPGLPSYDLGSPVFRKVELSLPDGGTFEIIAEGVSEDAKYIQEATINGQPLNDPRFSHDAIRGGGRLELRMSDQPKKVDL